MKFYKKMWKKTFNFTGLATRKEMWIPALINFGIFCVFAVFGFISTDILLIVEFFFFLVVAVPMLSLCVRRLHDVDRSGYNMFWVLFPVVGWIILTMYMIEKSKYNYHGTK